jgi:hypothetical protein
MLAARMNHIKFPLHQASSFGCVAQSGGHADEHLHDVRAA